ncbi:MAG TPA: imidazolonepropionase [Pyrinomonadaceae bacterium]|nr:imidazolonepropionase [Pyrinomonadaceae bacterium]
MRADLIIKTRGQVVTCRSNGEPKKGVEMNDCGILSGGAVAVLGGKIAAVGDEKDIFDAFDAGEVIDAGDRVICPGFVDPHTHIVFAGNRLDEFELKLKGAEYLEILELGGGIISSVQQTRAASEDELYRQSRRRLDKMLAGGTTTAEVKTGYGLDTGTELKMLNVIGRLDRDHAVDLVPTFLAAHAVPPEFRGDPDAYVSLICEEMLPAAWNWYTASHFAGKETPFYCDVFCEKNAFDLEQTRRLLQRAAALGFALKAHVDEFTNLGGSRLGIEMNAASIDHLDAISDDEIRLLAASDTIGIVTPTVNFNFGSHEFAHARELIDTGCAVAISTDYNPGSAPCPSQPMAMAIACRYQKLLPAEALNAATINAAYSIGQGSSRGSIEGGKNADILILDTTDHRDIAYEFGGNMVATVVKDGTVAHEQKPFRV